MNFANANELHRKSGGGPGARRSPAREGWDIGLTISFERQKRGTSG
jgi:hypothetical protein